MKITVPCIVPSCGGSVGFVPGDQDDDPAHDSVAYVYDDPLVGACDGCGGAYRLHGGQLTPMLAPTSVTTHHGDDVG